MERMIPVLNRSFKPSKDSCRLVRHNIKKTYKKVLPPLKTIELQFDVLGQKTLYFQVASAFSFVLFAVYYLEQQDRDKSMDQHIFVEA